MTAESNTKYIIYFGIACATAGFLLGYLTYPKLNKTEVRASAATEVNSSTTVKDIAKPPIDVILPAKVDTIYSAVVDTVSQETLLQDTNNTVDVVDIVATGDTTLSDGSYIGAEYSSAYQRFKFRLELKERVITNTVQATATVTNTVKESGGFIFFQIGGGLTINNEKVTPGIYMGIGYSTKLF